MGMYTTVEFKCTLRLDTPLNVLYAIDYLMNPYELSLDDSKLPEHYLFSTPEWTDIMRDFGGLGDCFSVCDKQKTGYELYFKSCFTNYYRQLEAFLSFIQPYIVVTSSSMVLGYAWYEEYLNPKSICYQTGLGLFINTHQIHD